MRAEVMWWLTSHKRRDHRVVSEGDKSALMALALFHAGILHLEISAIRYMLS